MDPHAVDLAGLNQNHHNGYAGQGSQFILDNISQWMQTYNPNVVLLMVGINDIYGGSTGHPTGLEGRLNSIVNIVTTLNPATHVIVGQITPYSFYTDSIVQYNSYIKNTLVPTYANQHKLVTTVDQYSNILTNGQIDPSLFCNGINHPSPVGYDRMAQTWFEGIQAVVTPEPSTFAILCTAFGGFFAWNWRKRWLTR
jgi:lysophospholipase L1-like esterase